MVQRNDLKPKIRLQANRLRCPECHAGADDFVFIIGDDLRFRFVIRQGGLKSPVYIRDGKYRKVMGVNKAQALDTGKFLTMICLQCGHSRKTGIPNI